ncbi:hypothetical protein FJZ33_02100 [Candidatus Poribacteria bacterium]|nr:hypothetical protein [Candidatus Poribacteria bacterium]
MKIKLLGNPPGGGGGTVIMITFCKIFIFMILLFVCFIPNAFSENYYADADNGNDSWDGKAPAFEGGSRGPWKTGIKKGLVAGDVMAFKRGCSGIYSSRYVHYSSTGGTKDNPIIIQSYGEGEKPKLCAATKINANEWTDLGDGRYSKVTNRRCAVLLEDLIGIDRASDASLSDGYWIYISATGTLYYKPTSGNTSKHDVRFIDTDGGNTVFMYLYNSASYFTIKDLKFIGNNIYSVGDSDNRLARYLSIQNCEFEYVPGIAISILAIGESPTRRIAHDIIIEDCIFRNCKSNMYFIGQTCGGFERIIIRRNKIYDSQMMAGIIGWTSPGEDSDGISAQNFRDCIIEYNEIIGGLCHTLGGIFIWQDSAFIGTGNIIRYNYISDIVGGGIVWGGSDTGNCNAQIYGNIVAKTGINKTYPTKWNDAYLWETIWTATAQIGSENWSWAYTGSQRNHRVFIKSSNITNDASVIRIGLKGNSAYASNIVSMYIGEKKDNDDEYDFARSPSQILMNGRGSFSIPRYSDIVFTDPLSFDIENIKDHLISFYLSANGYTATLNGISTNMWFKDTINESSIVDVSDYSSSTVLRNIAKIDSGSVLHNVKAVLIQTEVFNVYENSLALTKKNTIQEVADNAGSWYWDGSILYVRATVGLPGSNGKIYLVRHLFHFPDTLVGGITLNRVQNNNPISGVYNNVVYGSNINYHINFGDYFDLKNNISLDPIQYHVYAFNGINNNIFNFNCYYPANGSTFRIGSSNKTYEEWIKAAGEGHSITENPIFIAAESGDFRLNTGSPCIKAGTGVGVTNDIFGNKFRETPSMGAIEYYKISGVISPRSIGGIKHMPK